MTIAITHNGVKTTCEFPIRWAEVSFRKALELLERPSDLKKVSVFTGLDEATLAKAEIHNLDKVLAVLSFTNHPITLDLPDTCLGYPIIKDLESKSIAQAADVQAILAQFKEETPLENLKQYPLIVATYIAPSWFLNKEYDFKQAEAIAERFLDAPCTEVMAIGNFTVAKYVAWRNGMPKISHREDTLRTRLKQVMRGWLASLAFTIRFYLWKRSLPTGVKNFLNGQ